MSSYKEFKCARAQSTYSVSAGIGQDSLVHVDIEHTTNTWQDGCTVRLDANSAAELGLHLLRLAGSLAEGKPDA
jgi:hypothetical protein